LIPRPHAHTLFPYTTLFRSWCTTSRREPRSDGEFSPDMAATLSGEIGAQNGGHLGDPPHLDVLVALVGEVRIARPVVDGRNPQRSEEHTSELQSRENLVCRL